MGREEMRASRIKGEGGRGKSGEWHLGPSFGEQHPSTSGSKSDKRW